MLRACGTRKACTGVSTAPPQGTGQLRAWLYIQTGRLPSRRALASRVYRRAGNRERAKRQLGSDVGKGCVGGPVCGTGPASSAHVRRVSGAGAALASGLLRGHFFCQYAGLGKNLVVLSISCAGQNFYIASQKQRGASALAMTNVCSRCAPMTGVL